jgi:hypothetical protein
MCLRRININGVENFEKQFYLTIGLSKTSKFLFNSLKRRYNSHDQSYNGRILFAVHLTKL